MFFNLKYFWNANNKDMKSRVLWFLLCFFISLNLLLTFDFLSTLLTFVFMTFLWLGINFFIFRFDVFDNLFGFLLWWFGFKRNNFSNNRVHKEENKYKMNCNWGDILNLIKRGWKNKLLIDDNWINHKTYKRKNLE